MAQQQPEQPRYRGVTDGIARLDDPRYRHERHKRVVSGYIWLLRVVDRHSLQHLVDFIDNSGGDGNGSSHDVVITELELRVVRLVDPSDGGVNVLRDFFARSDTTLTKVTLERCGFGSQEDASRLLSAFQTNRTVTDLTICGIGNMRGAALGACSSGLLQNMPQLQRLNCSESLLYVEGVRAFQSSLQANRTLRELNVNNCKIGDEGIRLLTDALEGNAIIEILDIGWNNVKFSVLPQIVRLLESTRLQKIGLAGNNMVFGNDDTSQHLATLLSRHEFLKELNLSACGLKDGDICFIANALMGNSNDITRLMLVSTGLKRIAVTANTRIFNNEATTRHFVSTLQHKVSSVQELPGITGFLDATFDGLISKSLIRNEQLNRVDLLLSPPPRYQQQQQQHNHHGAAMIMFKTWHKAIVKFASVPNNAGASAIFKLFTARPQLLEKRLKRPAVVALAKTAVISQDQKRRRS